MSKCAYKILFITAMLFCAAYSSAQNEQETSITIKQKKNALKIDLFRPLTYGEFSIYYERAVGKRMSLELGGGPSLSHFRYYFPILVGTSYPNPGNPVGGGLGFTVHAGFRYYAVSKASLSGLYIGPEFRYRFDSRLHQKIIRSHIESLSFNVGYQINKKRIGFDFYVGPGVSYTYGIIEYEGYTYPNANYLRLKSYFSFYLNIGVKICVGW